MPIPSALRDRLVAVANADGHLVYATDYDGVLAPIVTDPTQAWPAPGAVAALQRLGAEPDVEMVVLTGRSPAEAQRFLREGPPDPTNPDNDATHNFELAAGSLRYTLPNIETPTPSGDLGGQVDGQICVIGSHGADVDPALGESYTKPLTGAEQARLARTASEIEEALAAEFPGLRRAPSTQEGDLNTVGIERKPCGVGVHVRELHKSDPQSAQAVLAFVERFHASHNSDDEPIYLGKGKKVREITVADASKGRGIDHLRERFPDATFVVAGDDITDISAFRKLGPDDTGIVVLDLDNPDSDEFRAELVNAGLLHPDGTPIHNNLHLVDSPTDVVEAVEHLNTCLAPRRAQRLTAAARRQPQLHPAAPAGPAEGQRTAVPRPGVRTGSPARRTGRSPRP